MPVLVFTAVDEKASASPPRQSPALMPRSARSPAGDRRGFPFHRLDAGDSEASCQQDAHIFPTSATDFRNGTLTSHPKGFRAIPSRRKP
jgi:hypothetical protein